AEEVLSTEGMVKYVAKSKANEFIIGTEVGILHRLRRENPGKKFYPASELAICPNMKLTTLEKVLWSLEDMKYEVKVPDNIRVKALAGVQKMLDMK
ncbi:MAG: quinolinate synthase NadA, partial [bacterium]